MCFVADDSFASMADPFLSVQVTSRVSGAVLPSTAPTQSQVDSASEQHCGRSFHPPQCALNTCSYPVSFTT
jgi:hypothetical protein